MMAWAGSQKGVSPVRRTDKSTPRDLSRRAVRCQNPFGTSNVSRSHCYSPDFGVRSSIGLALQNLRSGKVDGLRGTTQHVSLDRKVGTPRGWTHSEEAAVIGGLLSCIVDDGRTKVNELDPEVLVDYNVFVLDITCRGKAGVSGVPRLTEVPSLTMADAHAGEVVHDIDDLAEDEPRLVLRKACVLLDALK